MNKSIKINALAIAAALGTTPANPLHAQTTAPTADVLMEIIVTATRREEKLRDVAAGVSAVTGDQLQAIGAQDFGEYLSRTPGVAFNEGPPGLSTAVIRGVGMTAGLDQGQGATGYFINDIPMTEPGFALTIPDIDTFDVARVEVLRGPQGTLFGSASLGGAINYIANVADTSGVYGAAEASAGYTRHADGDANYRARAMVNVPLVDDKLALRLVATDRREAGYHNNIGTGVEGSDDLRVYGMRASLVYTPSDATTLSYLGLYQRTLLDDLNLSDMSIGELQRDTRIPVTGDLWTQIHSLRLDHEFSFGTFTALAAYNLKRGEVIDDYTAFVAPMFGPYAGPNPHRFLDAGKSDVRSLEMRLASPSGGRFEWLIGAMYVDTLKRNRDSASSEGISQILPPMPPGALIGDEYRRTTIRGGGEEAAVFGEASYHITDRLTFTAGGRLFDTSIRAQTEVTGVFGPEFIPAYDIDDSGFAPKVSLRFEANDDVMVYALASKGFRFGSPNTLSPDPSFVIPAGTTTDSLWNYELGTRLDLFDKKLLLDVTAFHIDWSNLQVRLIEPVNGFTYGANAGEATIDGVEATITLRPAGGLSLASSITYLDARLTETVPNSVLVEDKPLPSSAKWRLANTLAYDFGGTYRPTLMLLHRYTARTPGYLNEDTTFDAYHLYDARASIALRDVTVTLFVENVSDERATTFGFGEFEEFIVRPRTVGAQVNWSF